MSMGSDATVTNEQYAEPVLRGTIWRARYCSSCHAQKLKVLRLAYVCDDPTQDLTSRETCPVVFQSQLQVPGAIEQAYLIGRRVVQDCYCGIPQTSTEISAS